ncbi:MAG: hypothetical protein LBS50_08640 [Prevotellaceae bacterium]|jgi:hypothetical protein|nr:hypothetical protein [Prevotellaceae bacterium]
MLFVDNIDWLQIAFESSAHAGIENRLFMTRNLECSTPMFNRVEEVIFDNSLLFTPEEHKRWDCVRSSENGVIGVLCSELRTDKLFLPKDYCTFKFKNRALYVVCSDNEMLIIKILRQLENDFCFKKHHIVRLDLCRDFEKFKYGLLPETFIRNFFNDKIYLEGKKGRIPKRFNGTKIYYEGAELQEQVTQINQNVKSKKFQYEFEIISNEIDGKNRINTLTIGSKSSLIQRQLYNKTIEQQREEKPYLTEIHDKINSDRNKREIWRLEFRLKGAMLTVVDNEIKANNKEISNEMPLQIEDICNGARITAMIEFLIENKFTFREAANTQNKARDWKRIELFDGQSLDGKIKLKRIEIKSTSNRANKIYIRAEYTNDQSLRSYKEFENIIKSNYGYEMLEMYNNFTELKRKMYANEFNLTKFIEEKVKPSLETYVRNEAYKRKGG